MTHPNEDVVRRGFEAFRSGDMATMGQLLADDGVWHAGGRSQITGDYRGKAEVLGFFGKLAQLSGGTFRVDVHDVLANDEHVVALVKAVGSRNGRTMNDNGVQVFHVVDGKVVEEWFHPGDQYAADSFWA